MINDLRFKNVLHIDTSSNQEIMVELTMQGKKYVLKKKIGLQKAQVVLPLIDQLLKKYQLKLTDIDAITVNTGPGSFTGLRVGCSVANALAFALKIPVNGKKIGQFVEPLYQ